MRPARPVVPLLAAALLAAPSAASAATPNPARLVLQPADVPAALHLRLVKAERESLASKTPAERRRERRAGWQSGLMLTLVGRQPLRVVLDAVSVYRTTAGAAQVVATAPAELRKEGFRRVPGRVGRATRGTGLYRGVLVVPQVKRRLTTFLYAGVTGRVSWLVSVSGGPNARTIALRLARAQDARLRRTLGG